MGQRIEMFREHENNLLEEIVSTDSIHNIYPRIEKLGQQISL